MNDDDSKMPAPGTHHDRSTDPTVLQADRNLPLGARLGRYILKERLGVGGMAEVYLAEQDGPAGFKKRVVIKRILPHLAADATFVSMFVREAQVAARLSHPNVVQVYELGHDADEYFIAMEFIDGLTLQRVASTSWKRGHAVPIDVVCRTLSDAARGLHAAHTLRADDNKPIALVHRDISPDNLMVSRDGVTKVLDFGIAKGDELSGPKTRTGMLRGKIPYMSPEQIGGEPVDGRCDLWALGVSAYWLLTGERPFDRPSDFHTMAAIRTEEPKPLRALNPQVPEALEALVLSLLQKDKNRRPQSADVVAEAFDDLCSPGSSGGRKVTVPFVQALLPDVQATRGNPLSEGQVPDPVSLQKPPTPQATGTAVFTNTPAQKDNTPVSTLPFASSAGSSGSALSDPGALPQETVQPPPPRPASSTLPPLPSDVGLPPGAATPATAAPARPLDDVTTPNDAPLATGVATIAPAAPSAKPKPQDAGPTFKPPPRGGIGQDSAPVVDILTPKPGTSPLAIVGVLGVVALLIGGAVFLVFRLLNPGPDAGGGIAAVVDAGAVAAVVDGGAVDAVVDAGAVAAVVDAGAVAAVVDAGAVAAAVDAGVVAAAVDAGTVEPVKPAVPVGPRTKAPARITWRLEDGTILGRGTTTLRLPKGTQVVIAHDVERGLRVPMTVDGLKPLDYGSLPMGKLVLPTPPPGTRMMLGASNVDKGQTLDVTAGIYLVRFMRDGKTQSQNAKVEAGKTFTVVAPEAPPAPKR